MRKETGADGLTLLERLDVALAARLSERLPGVPGAGVADPQCVMSAPSVHTLRAWIAGTLGLRGFVVDAEDVGRAVDGEPGRLSPEHREYRLVLGLHDVARHVLARAAEGAAPQGWALVGAFQRLTTRLSGYGQSPLRQDQPWDGIVHLRYPEPPAIPALLEEMTAAAGYGEQEALWESLHPVRRAFRVLWRFARIAPFPDYNLVLAFVAMSQYLQAAGYPLIVPESADRALLQNVISRPVPPPRIVQLETRLLRTVERT